MRNELSTGIPEKMVEQSSKRIKELSYESGKEVLSVTIEKKWKKEYLKEFWKDCLDE